MSDLIDRQALYEKMAELEAQALHMVEKTMNDENKTEWRKWSTILTERSAFKFDVADAPPAQPDVPDSKVGEWIPCAERLPLYNIRVLVIDKYGGIDIAELVDYSDVDEPDEWWTHEYKIQDPVLAWMPLPKPWTGEAQ